MSNLNYRSQFFYSNAGQFVKLLAKVSIGASGAPTIVSGTGMGISGVTRVSAGRYRVDLTNPFVSMLGLEIVSKAAAAPAAPVMSLVTDTNVSSVSAPSFTFACYNGSGTATDPASGEVLYIEADFNKSALST